MANLLIDGFDWFPAGLSLADRGRLMGANSWYTAPNGYTSYPDVVPGRFGFGQALAYSDFAVGFSPTGHVIPLGVTPASGFIGGAMFVSNDSNGQASVGFYDAAGGGYQLTVSFASVGIIRVYRGTTLIASSLPGSFQQNEWFHFEIFATIATTGGGCEVRINTVPKVQLASANTQTTANAYFDSVFVGSSPAGGNYGGRFNVDDLFVNDTTGTSNNTWTGNVRVKTQFMVGNGATDLMVIGGTAPAATNWQSVLNQALDDTKFVYSPTVGNLDLYTPDPNLNAPAVRAIQVRAALRQDDATQRSAKMILRIGATTYTGATEFFTNQTFTFYKQRWDMSPATAVQFTGAEVNGLQAGVKVQS